MGKKKLYLMLLLRLFVPSAQQTAYIISHPVTSLCDATVLVLQEAASVFPTFMNSLIEIQRRRDGS